MRHFVPEVLLKHQNWPGLVIVGLLYCCDNEAIKQKQTKFIQEEGKMKKVSKTSKKGFSLVELVVVIAIIVILASVVCFNYLHIFQHIMEVCDNL